MSETTFTPEDMREFDNAMESIVRLIKKQTVILGGTGVVIPTPPRPKLEAMVKLIKGYLDICDGTTAFESSR